MLLCKWPKWEKNFINIIGERFSGKTHLTNIFLDKFKGIKINLNQIDNHFLKTIKIYENIIIEDLNKNIDENLFFTLLNIIEQDNKYLIITSTKPIVDFKFKSIFLQTLMETLFNEAVKRMVKAFENRANELYNSKLDF